MKKENTPLEKCKNKIRKHALIKLAISTLIFSIVTILVAGERDINGVVAYLKPYMDVYSSSSLLLTLAVVVSAYAYIEKLARRYAQFGVRSESANSVIQVLGEEIPNTIASFAGVVLGICMVIVILAAFKNNWEVFATFLGYLVFLFLTFWFILTNVMFCFSSDTESDQMTPEKMPQAITGE